MKKIICIAAILILAGSSAQAQSYESGFHLSFIPPVSTNGSQAAQYTNGASFNILVGLSKNEKAFTFGGLANIVTQDAKGFQFAGLANYVGGHGSGMLFSGLANLVGGNYNGFQFAGLGNTAGELSGMQFGGLVNIADDVKGFQFGGLGNVATDMRGFQFGGLGNVARDVKGFQFGGLGNVARDVRGFQFGGVFNVAKRVSGVQFAGLVNIAESSDYPIAMINIIRDGEYGIGVTYNEMGSVMATLRSGGRVTYGILGVGYNHKAKKDGFTVEGGYGVHIPITRWLRINNEVKAGVIRHSSEKGVFYCNYALLPAFRLGHHLEIFGGPSINYMNSDSIENKNLFPSSSLWRNHNDSRLQQLYIGWQVGVQFII